MNKPRAELTTSAVFLSAVLVVSYFQSQEPTIKATEVLTWDCESAVYKPESITLTCADGGMTVGEIKWQRWDTGEAIGTGIYIENSCQPDCARGKFVQTPVTISLTNLIEYKSKFHLKDLAITPTNGKNFPNGNKLIIWDLSEYPDTISIGG
jgi:hypothetical protein